MAIASEGLTDVYARYFFSLFDACLHEDETGRLQAQAALEDHLKHLHEAPWPTANAEPLR